ncbi:MAG: PASTA domain-containing protein [Betaproteobacteria bacterium]|nr:PASTA domain-containing protein [Betaproteobacteria bacterium]
MGLGGNVKRTAARWLALILTSLLAAPVWPDSQPPSTPDATYVALEKTIRETPIEAMNEAWIIDRIYKATPEPQKYLKLILGDPDLAAKNERMARLRQAYDLRFWFEQARTRGWMIELTNQGKANGHRSDHDQTGWIIAGPAANKPKNFAEVQRLWESYHEGKGVKPAQPDMSLFNGDQFLPDPKNARLGSDEFITRMAGIVLELRADKEAYYVPGANKEQVHRRALAEGKTLHIAWDHELGMPVLNGKPFDIDAFIAGKTHITYLRTSDIAARYRGVHPDAPWRMALGNLAQNLNNFLTHLTDPISRQKYANRILDAAFSPLLGVTYGKKPDGPDQGSEVLKKYRELAPAEKRHFILQMYGDKTPAARVDELVKLFDLSARIEMDKVTGSAPYDAARYYKDFLPEAEASLRARKPDLSGEELRKRSVEEAERIFIQKQLLAYAEGASQVLSHAVMMDFDQNSGLVNRRRFVGSKVEYEEVVKRQAERQVEIALLFEVVERIDDGSVRARLRGDLINASGNVPGLHRMFTQFSELAQAGREAVDDWLAESSRKGRIADPTAFYKRIGDKVERIVGPLDAAAARQPREISLTRTRAMAAAADGPAAASRRAQFVGVLKAAKAGATQYAGEYWDDFVDGLDFFFVADNAVNLLRSYERNCLDGRLAPAACGQRLAIDTASNLLWNLPLIENYAGMVGGVMAVSQGDAGGFLSFTVALAPRLGVGAGVLPIYTVYGLAAGVYEVTYSYVVETLDNDLLEQALKSLPESGKRAQRCGDASTFRADTPEFPLFAGPGGIATDADKWDAATRMGAARAQFGPAADQALLARGLKPGNAAWDTAREAELRRFACELPYHQRMARLYPHLKGELQRYIDDAARRGKDMDDMSFPVMDSCVERENKARGDARKAAEAKGREALEDWLLEEAEKPSPIVLCLPKGVEAASAVLRPFMTKQVHDWLGRQPTGYQDEFSTTVERATEGNRIMNDLRRLGSFLGLTDSTPTRSKLMDRLTDAMTREYVLSQYNHERREEQNRELARQFAGLAVRVAGAERLLRAIGAGENDLGKDFVQATARAAADIYTKPPPEIRPTLKLRLPTTPIRLGEEYILSAGVRGEYAPGDDAAPANDWKIDYTVNLLPDVKEEVPAGLVVTPGLAKALQVKGNAVYTLRASVVARLKDQGGAGRVLAEDKGELVFFDVRAKPAKADQPHQTPSPAAVPDLKDILDGMRQAENDAAAAAREARQRCDDAARQVKQADTDLQALTRTINELGDGTNKLQAWLDQAKSASDTAERQSRQAYAAGEDVAEARKRADFAAAAACDGVPQVQRATTEEARRQALQGIVAAVQRCKGELDAVRKAEQAARQAAADCDQARQSLPPQPLPAATDDTARKKVEAAQDKVNTRLTGVHGAQDQARAGIARAGQSRDKAGRLADEGRKRLEPVKENKDGRKLMAQMDEILSRMDQVRRGVEGCPDAVTDALTRAEAAARAAAERAQKAEDQAGRMERAVTEGRDLKAAEASCNAARASADTAALLAESARVMCQDAATCQAIAEDLARQPLVTRVPDVAGLPLADAQARIAQAGLRAGGGPAGDPAPTVDREGTVQSQAPGPGQEVAKGSVVSLRVWGPPDRNTLLAATDCSWLAGGVPMWDTQTNQPGCGCPSGTIPSNQQAACLDCAELEIRFAAAFNSRQVQLAQAILAEAAGCPWTGRAAAALQNAQQQDLDCMRIENDILGALVAGDLNAARGLLGQARQMGCNIDPRTLQSMQDAEDMRRQQDALRQQPVLPPFPNIFGPFTPQPVPGGTPQPSGPPRQVACNDTAKQGGNTPETLVVDLGRPFGSFRFDFDMYTVPDRMIVHYPGGTYDTGCVGSKLGAGRGKGSVTLRYSGGTQVTVQVQPACMGESTQWQFVVHCPK